MAKDPADRYQSAAEMLADLAKIRDVAPDRGDGDVTDAAARPTRPAARRVTPRRPSVGRRATGGCRRSPSDVPVRRLAVPRLPTLSRV